MYILERNDKKLVIVEFMVVFVSYGGGKLHSSHIEEDWIPEYVNRHPPIG
jgi:hypothetical protein